MSINFLALYAKDADFADMQVLTPKAMKWSDDGMWILDLRPCLSFWSHRARNMGLDVVGLIRKVLQTQFSAENHEQTSIGATAGYQGALADNPWLAIVFLNYVRERNLGGLVNLAGPSTLTFFRELSWSAWWKSAIPIAQHFESCKRKHFSPASFRGSCEQMQKAIGRLGILTPWELKTVDSLAVNRRFGTVLRDLWQWTWSALEPEDSNGGASDLKKQFASGFPWQSFQATESPMISRHLEAPLLEWDHMEPLLQEDLNRMCDLDSWDSREGVMRLEWEVVSYDMTAITVPICFRHPHSLASERNSNFVTTTLQAYYSFTQIMKSTMDDQDTDGYLNPPSPIISWRIKITERLRLSAKIRDLFGHSDRGNCDLMNLENRLPIELINYDLRQDWLPEDSYCHADASGERQDSMIGQATASLQAISRRRPLFLYRNPIFYDNHGHSVTWMFLERIMTKWWEKKPNSSPQRDYYKLIGKDQRAMWVFKDFRGNWYTHGVFA
jgi:hypothetical protein